MPTDHVPDGFTWPTDPTVEALGGAIAAARNLEITIAPIPERMRHHEISGMTVVVGSTAHVFHDVGLSPLNREQTLLHEYAHILHGDVRADTSGTHLRSVFDDLTERRAETTGMRLLRELHRRQEALGRPRPCEVITFLSASSTHSRLS
ncbi:hypothetical protein [Actinomyces wuliandei]|uniref:hypothetical protein n=1 Tax=Actinomyces wuliandei TaxID=2057743 RepID=UPI000FDCC004|nr:hypothetical protein [Actinomyces wuliandei]